MVNTNSWIGLALWGGAAKWLIQIGVIRYLEENNIVPNAIAGTSTWSVIWSALALWFSSQKMNSIAQKIKMINLVDADFVNWFLQWDKVEKFFEKIFGNARFSDTKIPLTILATDIKNGKRMKNLRCNQSINIVTDNFLTGRV